MSWVINSLSRRVEAIRGADVVSAESSLITVAANGNGVPLVVRRPTGELQLGAAWDCWNIWAGGLNPFDWRGDAVVYKKPYAAAGVTMRVEMQVAFTVSAPVVKNVHAWFPSNSGGGLLALSGPGLSFSISSGGVFHSSVTLTAGSYTVNAELEVSDDDPDVADEEHIFSTSGIFSIHQPPP